MGSATLGATLCVFLAFISCASCRREARAVIVGVDNSPPFYIFQPNGSVQGLAVEVLSEAARRRKIQIRWVPLADTSLDEALASRRVQMWPAVGATPDREAKLFLSEPWIETDYVLVSPKDKPVRNTEEAAGLTVSHARLRGTTILARRYLVNSKLKVLPDRSKAFQEMCLGNTAAAFLELRMVEAMLLDRPENCGNLPLNISNVRGAITPLSIAAVPESAALARELRSEISKMVIDGEFGTIMDRWAPFSAEVARSLGAERTEGVRNRYLTLFAGCLSMCAILLGFLTRRAHKLRLIATAAEKEMRKQAAEDSLTKLANRTVFTEHLTRCIQQGHREAGLIFGVFFLDLDHFKVINDSLGHLAGDQLLVGIARRLTQTVRSSDLIGHMSKSCTIARFGGDEFVVLIENIQTCENAMRIADRIQQEMSIPFLVLDGHSVCTTFSIGIALSSRHEESAEDILRDADTAMYAAKTSGKACTTVFDSAMRARAAAQLASQTDLYLDKCASVRGL